MKTWQIVLCFSYCLLSWTWAIPNSPEFGNRFLLSYRNPFGGANSASNSGGSYQQGVPMGPNGFYYQQIDVTPTFSGDGIILAGNSGQDNNYPQNYPGGIQGQYRPGLNGNFYPGLGGLIYPGISGLVNPGLTGVINPGLSGLIYPGLNGISKPGFGGFNYNNGFGNGFTSNFNMKPSTGGILGCSVGSTGSGGSTSITTGNTPVDYVKPDAKPKLFILKKIGADQNKN